MKGGNVSGHWIRLDLEFPDDPRTWALAGRLEIDEVTALGHVVRLTVFAAKFAVSSEGDVSKFDPPTIARAAGWVGDPVLFVDAVTAAGWLIARDDRLELAGWSECQGVLIERRARDAARKRRQRRDAVDCASDAPLVRIALCTACEHRGPMDENTGRETP